MMIEDLIKLESVVPPGLVVALNRGVDVGDLKSSHGVRYGSTEELRILYGWKNGEKLVDTDPALFGVSIFGFRLLSLDESAKQCEILRRFMRGMDFPVSYLPIGHFDGGLVVATLDNVSIDDSMVFRFISEEGSLFLWHENVRSMVRTFLHLWVNGGDFDEVAALYSPRFGLEVPIT